MKTFCKDRSLVYLLLWVFLRRDNRGSDIQRRAEYGFGRVQFQAPISVSFWPSLTSAKKTQRVPLSLVFVCKSKLSEFSRNSMSFVQNSVSSLFRNSTLQTVFSCRSPHTSMVQWPQHASLSANSHCMAWLNKLLNMVSGEDHRVVVQRALRCIMQVWGLSRFVTHVVRLLHSPYLLQRFDAQHNTPAVVLDGDVSVQNCRSWVGLTHEVIMSSLIALRSAPPLRHSPTPAGNGSPKSLAIVSSVVAIPAGECVSLSVSTQVLSTCFTISIFLSAERGWFWSGGLVFQNWFLWFLQVSWFSRKIGICFFERVGLLSNFILWFPCFSWFPVWKTNRPVLKQTNKQSSSTPIVPHT